VLLTYSDESPKLPATTDKVKRLHARRPIRCRSFTTTTASSDHFRLWHFSDMADLANDVRD
jgi:hypothetical protein